MLWPRKWLTASCYFTSGSNFTNRSLNGTSRVANTKSRRINLSWPTIGSELATTLAQHIFLSNRARWHSEVVPTPKRLTSFAKPSLQMRKPLATSRIFAELGGNEN